MDDIQSGIVSSTEDIDAESEDPLSKDSLSGFLNDETVHDIQRMRDKKLEEVNRRTDDISIRRADLPPNTTDRDSESPKEVSRLTATNALPSGKNTVVTHNLTTFRRKPSTKFR